MTTKWVVTTASERVALDEATRGGEATFMVTNQSAKSARAMFDIKTGDGVDESWFSIEDPQRPIRPAASVPYLVRIQVPQTVPPGQYEFEARVYPPDSAPEENFVLSRRVLLEVPKKPEPPKKKFPWWIVVAAALLVLVIGVVTWIVWPSGAVPEPIPSASPTPQVSAEPVALVVAPKLFGQTIDAARKTIIDAGLAVGDVGYIQAPAPSQIVRQSVPPGLRVPKGSRVDVTLAMPFGRPTITAPGANTSQPPGRWPTISWTQPEAYVSKWQVTIQAERCTRTVAGGPEACGTFVGIDAVMVTTREYTGAMPELSYAVPATGSRHTGWINVIVFPIDDDGIVAGQNTSVKFFLEH